MSIDPLAVAVRLDEDLGPHAVGAVDEFIDGHVCDKLSITDEWDWPIRRSQIAGLRLIASNEPDRVAEFAQKQSERERAKLHDREARSDHERDRKASIVIAFWDLVQTLCAPRAKERDTCSLQQACDEAIPPEYRDDDQRPKAQLTIEERQERNRRKKAREEFQRQWKAAYYPVFFQRFCAHYLYRMSQLTRPKGARKS
jgi:hypothetical protein